MDESKKKYRKSSSRSSRRKTSENGSCTKAFSQRKRGSFAQGKEGDLGTAGAEELQSLCGVKKDKNGTREKGHKTGK